MSPPIERDVADAMRAARVALGDRSFHIAWECGAAGPLAQAVAAALVEERAGRSVADPVDGEQGAQCADT
jgi:hypothetical protein